MTRPLEISPALIEQLPQAWAWLGPDLRIRTVNAVATALFGIDEDALFDRPLESLIKLEDRPRFLHGLSQTGRPLHLSIGILQGAHGPWTADLRLKALVQPAPAGWLLLLEDVGDNQKALQALRQSEERYRRVVEASPVGVALLEDNLVSFANGAMEALLGLDGPEDLWGSELESVVHPDDLVLWNQLMDALEGPAACTRELRMLRSKGQTVDAEVTVQRLGAGPSPALLLCNNITQRKAMERRLRESEERYKGLADVAFDGLAVHFEGVILTANRNFESIFGKGLGELLGEDLFTLFSPESADLLRHELDSGQVLELKANGPQGSDIHLEASTRACLYHGDPAYVTAVRDVTVRRLDQDQVEHQAWYDALTNLPNRILFLDRLSHGLEKARRENRRLAVLFLDLDRFKMVNDSLGHASGDQLLQLSAGRLQALLRKSDTLARLGGDEFVVLLEDSDAETDAMAVGRKIIESLREPFSLGGHEAHIGASVGVALFPDHADSGERLLKLADMAMYRAKKSGRNQVTVYAEALESKQESRLDRENELRRAIERQEFRLWYQPQVEVATGKIVGAEALLRWQHPSRGLLLPEQFMALAEETHLIVPLGEWVLHNTCDQAARWQPHRGMNLSVAVNLSAWQLNKRNLLKVVDAALARSGLPASRLELEITETVAMRNPAVTLEMLRDFADRGVRLALDDFGKGYSSLNYLKEFPVHSLKVDQSFVDGLPNDKKDAAIVRAILALGRSLGLVCLAEGVERREQLDFLKAEGCDLAQGFFMHRPMPAEQLDALLGAEER